jgi:hypothetical protein
MLFLQPNSFIAAHHSAGKINTMKIKIFLPVLFLLSTIALPSFKMAQVIVIPPNLTVRLKVAQDVRFQDLQVGKPVPCTVVDDVIHEQIVVVRSGATASVVVDAIDCEGRKTIVRLKGTYVRSRDGQDVRLTDQSVKVSGCCNGKAEVNTEIVTTTSQAFKIRL